MLCIRTAHCGWLQIHKASVLSGYENAFILAMRLYQALMFDKNVTFVKHPRGGSAKVTRWGRGVKGLFL